MEHTSTSTLNEPCAGSRLEYNYDILHAYMQEGTEKKSSHGLSLHIFVSWKHYSDESSLRVKLRSSVGNIEKAKIFLLAHELQNFLSTVKESEK